MLKKLYIIVFLLLLSIFLFTDYQFFRLKNDEKIILRRIRDILIKMHFSLKRIDNNFSKEVFIKYLEGLDPYKRYFKESDIYDFKQYENKIDDHFIHGSFNFYIFTLHRFLKRLDESEKIIYNILSNSIKLYTDEYLILDKKLRKYAFNDKIYYNEWKKFVINYILIEIQTIYKYKNTKHYNINLKLNNIDNYIYIRDNCIENWKKHKIYFLNKLKNSAIFSVKKIMKDYFRKIKIKKKKDYFSIYINSFVQMFDPHTIYFPPKDSFEFHANISGNFIGLGVKLQDIKGYPVFSEIILGGPVWKNKNIDIGDKLLKVGENINKLHNVVGLLLEDTIELIRGKEKSRVFLVIQKQDGTIKTVSLMREKIELSDHFVKSLIIKNYKNEKFGFIALPEFYTDLDNPNYGRNCSEDFKKEIFLLKKENIKGLIIDLRGNGGGSLSEVIKIVGFFIGKGPIVKVCTLDGYEQVYENKDISLLYNGLLLVIVDEFSASASEIFAAAIQDYKRGLILGSYKTFGKGTVQSVISLDPLNIMSNIYGSLKLTVQKFYRINGVSTQIQGVKPDILLPSIYQYLNILESNQKNVLSWDATSSLHYKTFDYNINYNIIKYYSKKRIKNHIFLKKIREKAKWLYFLNEEQEVPLNYQEFQEKSNIRKKISKKYNSNLDFSTKLIMMSFQNELFKIKKNNGLNCNKQKWYQFLSKDFYIYESIAILSDCSNLF